MDGKSSIRSIHKTYFELLEAHFKRESSPNSRKVAPLISRA